METCPVQSVAARFSRWAPSGRRRRPTSDCRNLLHPPPNPPGAPRGSCYRSSRSRLARQMRWRKRKWQTQRFSCVAPNEGLITQNGRAAPAARAAVKMRKCGESRTNSPPTWQPEPSRAWTRLGVLHGESAIPPLRQFYYLAAAKQAPADPTLFPAVHRSPAFTHTIRARLDKALARGLIAVLAGC